MLVSGSYFGEMPLLFSGKQQVATYEAGPSGCGVIALPRTAFLSLFADDKSLLAEVHIKLMRENCTLQDIVDHRRARRLFANHLDNRRLGASHTLDFHTAVDRYEKVCKADLPAALLVISQSVVGEFVMRRSPHAVPLSDESREVILAAHARGTTHIQALTSHTPMLSHSQPSPLCTTGAVPASILNKEADASFQALSTNDLPGFLESSAFQELLSSLGSYSAELVATNAQCTQFDLEVFEKFAQAARDGNVGELKFYRRLIHHLPTAADARKRARARLIRPLLEAEPDRRVPRECGAIALSAALWRLH